ncbi:MAG TPA: hypothetical protein VFC09_02725 [Candidatus Dormibacteraeota bacterium]|nr:hypothetical protein [Candidatus Dormibacteraeota bacterium]
MARYAFPVPVLPGKVAASVAGVYTGRQAEYEESRRQKGITLERVYLMPTPMGEFAIPYLESEQDFATTFNLIATSDLPIDRDFRAAVLEVHGVDVTQPPPGPPPEVVGHWRDPDVTSTDRRKGLTFISPLQPGKTDVGRAFAQQAFTDRVAEHTASRRALGITQETVTLNSGPDGDVVCVYLEGHDPADGNNRFSASNAPYDLWFKEQLRSFMIPEIDFAQPLPPISTIWDWHRSPVPA